MRVQLMQQSACVKQYQHAGLCVGILAKYKTNMCIATTEHAWLAIQPCIENCLLTIYI